jgi:hypothetical protein
MALDERDFFNNRDETRTDKLACPRCKRTNEYRMRWVVRTRKDRIPPGADERDRALFAKLRDYMIRVDDAVTCKTCGKKFDYPLTALDGVSSSRVASSVVPPVRS